MFSNRMFPDTGQFQMNGNGGRGSNPFRKILILFFIGAMAFAFAGVMENQKNEQAETHLAEMQAKQADMQKNIADLKADLGNVQSANTDLQNKLELSNQKVYETQAKLDQSNQAITVSEIEKKNLQKALKDERGKSANLTSQLENNMVMINDLSAQLDASNRRIGEMGKRIQQQEEMITAMQKNPLNIIVQHLVPLNHQWTSWLYIVLPGLIIAATFTTTKFVRDKAKVNCKSDMPAVGKVRTIQVSDDELRQIIKQRRGIRC